MGEKFVYSVCLEVNISKTKEESFDPEDPYFILKNLIFTVTSIKGVKPSLDTEIDKIIERTKNVIETLEPVHMKLKYETIREKCINILKYLEICISR